MRSSSATSIPDKLGQRDAALGTGQVVDLPSGKIAYTERGSGPPVVFVHGLLVNANLWRKVVPAVAGAGFRLHRAGLAARGASGAHAE
jgi:pimeloyl-ACP methyl ester carboxylesterase